MAATAVMEEPCENCGTPIIHSEAITGPVAFVSTVADRQWLEIRQTGPGGYEWCWHTPDRCRERRLAAATTEP